MSRSTPTLSTLSHSFLIPKWWVMPPLLSCALVVGLPLAVRRNKRKWRLDSPLLKIWANMNVCLIKYRSKQRRIQLFEPGLGGQSWNFLYNKTWFDFFFGERGVDKIRWQHVRVYLLIYVLSHKYPIDNFIKRIESYTNMDIGWLILFIYRKHYPNTAVHTV